MSRYKPAHMVGRLVHAVPVDTSHDGHGAALCGGQPRRETSRWDVDTVKAGPVTCPRCIARLKKLYPPDPPDDPIRDAIERAARDLVQDIGTPAPGDEVGRQTLADLFDND